MMLSLIPESEFKRKKAAQAALERNLKAALKYSATIWMRTGRGNQNESQRPSR